MTLDDQLKPTELRQERGSTKAYNLMWVAPRLPPKDGVFYQPIPAKTVENMGGIAERNRGVDVRLWVDSQRVTEAQMEWMRGITAEFSCQNLSLCDLRTLDDYNREPLYSQPDTNPNWRIFKGSLIWKQVDAARILACLHCLEKGYEQAVYSDADITNLVVDSKDVQHKLRKYGIIISGSDRLVYENGLFGFSKTKQEWCRQLYEETVKSFSGDLNRNGYSAFSDWITEHARRGDINMRTILFYPKFDGTEARHNEL